MKFSLPVFYFTQLMGLSMGIPANRLGIGTEFLRLLSAMLAAC